MKTTVIREGLVSIGEDELRVELGPPRKKVKCTEEILRASGRQVPGDRVTLRGREVTVQVVRDAMGKPVTLGKPMTIIDRAGVPVWYLYRRELAKREIGDATEEVEIFREIGIHPGDRDAAVAECIRLAKEG